MPTTFALTPTFFQDFSQTPITVLGFGTSWLSFPAATLFAVSLDSGTSAYLSNVVVTDDENATGVLHLGSSGINDILHFTDTSDSVTLLYPVNPNPTPPLKTAMPGATGVVTRAGINAPLRTTGIGVASLAIKVDAQSLPVSATVPGMGFGAAVVWSSLPLRSVMPAVSTLALPVSALVGLTSPMPSVALGTAEVFAPAQRSTPVIITSHTVANTHSPVVSLAFPAYVASTFAMRIVGAVGERTVMPVISTSVSSVGGKQSLVASPVFIAGPLAAYVGNALGSFPVVTLHGSVFGPVIEPAP